MDVLAWYESVKYKVPKIHGMSTSIFSIPHTQIQNEREFSLAGVIGRASGASVSVEMLSDLLFINQNMDAILHEKSIELFDGMLNSQNDDLVDEVAHFLTQTMRLKTKATH
jgi:sarcosine oxidase delta subunit